MFVYEFRRDDDCAPDGVYAEFVIDRVEFDLVLCAGEELRVADPAVFDAGFHG